MLVLTPVGLYCEAGDFYIDPCGAVDRAVITHAHADHARRGSQMYFCVSSGAGLLRARIGRNIRLETHAYGEVFFLGGVKISFHPAGHILGSSQLRMELEGKVWVASGDYKRDSDPTCEPFEAVPCDVFVTEATFGTPAYRWNKNADLGAEIFSWWQDNASAGLNSVLFAYSLGKTQRILGLLAPYGREVYCDEPSLELSECYREQGIRLAPFKNAREAACFRGALILAPRSFLDTKREAIGEHRTAFASGWTAKDTRGFDRGFVLSDHADWDDLTRTVLESRAKRVYVQHRGMGALVRHLRGLGIEAFPVEALAAKQRELF